MQERAGKTEVFQYDEVPEKLRIQIWHILTDAIGRVPEKATLNTLNRSERYKAEGIRAQMEISWKQIHDDLAKEIGFLDIYQTLGRKPILDLDCNAYFKKCEFFLLETTLDQVWDLVELCFCFIKSKCDKLSVDELINEFNVYCRDHAVGYEHVNDKIIRVDSQYVHAEVVLPALNLLQDSRFDGASEEFLNAHKHFREGRNNEAVNAANNAFESTMKNICTIEKWKFKQSHSAADLVDILFKNKLIPDYHQRHFSKLTELLKSGVSTIRNKETAHGQGSKSVNVSNSLAAYALHLTASNIVFLVSAMNDQ